MKRQSILHFAVPAMPTISRKAFADGDTRSQLRRVAKKRADATWLCLILAALEWYFVNWVWALVPLGLVAFTALQAALGTAAASRPDKRQSPPI
jgi:hypothetical protein